MDQSNILLVDDDSNAIQSLGDLLRSEGFHVLKANDGASGLKVLEKNPVDLVITDERMPDLTGIELLRILRQTNPLMPVIFLTGYGTVELAVQAMKDGAYHFFEKPVDVNLEPFLNVIKHALKLKRRESLSLFRTSLPIVRARVGRKEFIANDPIMVQLFDLLPRIALTDKTILIQGESGTGKDLIARAIHEMSDRKALPFVTVSCGALTESLLTSELFGHIKGAFTGAIRDQRGRFELAKDGTIFLDEIDAIPLSLQQRLLRVLQWREFERVGDSRPQKMSARIIAASNRDLQNEVENETFRQDLFHRLNVIPIKTPSLRERPGDIPPLVEHFLETYKESPVPSTIEPEVIEFLQRYSWPGNVRELENLIQQLIVFSEDEVIRVANLPHHIFYHTIERPAETISDVSLPDVIEEIEKKYISIGLQRFKWNHTLTARSLGISRKMLGDRMNKYGISRLRRGAGGLRDN